MKKVFITRHGQTDWNKVPKVQGVTDVPFNDEGKKQAQELAEFIKTSNLHFDKILCSPLSGAFFENAILNDNISV